MRTSALFRSWFVAGSVALAVVTATAPAAAGAATPAQATPVQREQAQARFVRGRELYSAGRYDAALAEFTASLDIVSSPNTRLYVGRCLREMGRLVAAYVELGRTAVEAKELTREDPRYQKAGEAASEERAQLAPKLGFVDVSVAHPAPTTSLKVGNDEVRRGGWSEPVPVMPGTAEVTVETPGHPPIRKTVEVAAGGRQSVAIDASGEPAPPTAAQGATGDGEQKATDDAGEPKYRPLAYAAGGLAVAGLATFAIAGTLANGTYSDLEQVCGEKPCPPGHEDEISRGKTQQTFANVGLGVFIVGAAAAVTLFVVGTPRSSSKAAARLQIGPGYAGLRGAF
jgi:hypothetical protein